MKLGMVFPGQGSQSIGMMRGFENLSIVRDTFTESSDILQTDLWSLVEQGPLEALNQTSNTQPLMLTAGIAVYRAWQQQGGAAPSILAGHSLGEYTALVASGVVTLTAAIPLVRFRADAMQNAVPMGTGGIAAILGLDDDVVRTVCADAAQGEIVEAVNYNSPAQVVIAGHKLAVERAMKLAQERGAKKTIPLPMSVPSHCSLMKGAAEQLRLYLDSVAMLSPLIPVIQNADVTAHSDIKSIKAALVKQLYSPVRWVETIQTFIQKADVSTVIESGPGKVLTGLCKRIDSQLNIFALNDTASLRLALTSI
jgi:[acyl-carrier-protein] S-malonyltransferase